MYFQRCSFELGKVSDAVDVGMVRSSKCPAAGTGHSLGSWWHDQARPPAHKGEGQDQRRARVRGRMDGQAGTRG